MIGFNEKKDHTELDMNDLENFINFQYKKKGTELKNSDDTSSDEEMQHMFRK